jgi:hypothetical protein
MLPPNLHISIPESTPDDCYRAFKAALKGRMQGIAAKRQTVEQPTKGSAWHCE